MEIRYQEVGVCGLSCRLCPQSGHDGGHVEVQVGTPCPDTSLHLSIVSFELMGEAVEGFNSEGLTVCHLADDESHTRTLVHNLYDIDNRSMEISFFLRDAADAAEGGSGDQSIPQAGMTTSTTESIRSSYYQFSLAQ